MPRFLLVRLAHALGLDRPLSEQFWHYLRGLSQFDLLEFLRL